MNDETYIETELKENQKEMRQKSKWKFVYMLLIPAFLLILFLLPKGKQPNESGVFSDGFITSNAKSAEYEDLFYLLNGKYMIDITGLDKITSIDSLTTEDGYVINNIFDQVFIQIGNMEYSINSNKIIDDDNYSAPVLIENKIYADTDSIMSAFGYETEYNKSADGSVVELKITKTNQRYKDIFTNSEIEKEEVETMPQVEESVVQEIGKNPNKAEDELPTVPEPTKESNVEESSVAETTTQPESTEYSQENETESVPEETETVEHLPYNPNRKTEEEFEQIWQEDKSTLKDIYQNSPPNFKQDNYAELTEDTIVFNEATDTVYQNSISVTHEPITGEFELIEFCSDWSDQALNVSSDVSKAYYQNIENVYHQTLLTVLGSVTGEEFFQYLKSHADKTTNGGYISVKDESGNTKSVWTDGPVGDGIVASELDLGNWQERETDDGLRFDVVRNGNGIVILIYKD